MRTTRTHYEILGLPRNATPAQIKRRYRELVRKYHPDVAADKAASHRLFLQINQAYEVLKDSARRKSYDESLELDEMIRAKRAAARRQTQSGGTAAPRSAATPPPHAPRNVSQLLKDAQFAFISKRLNSAADLCKQAIAMDPRNARANAMLGDIYRAQGKIDAAIKRYTYAVQFDPTDSESQRKMLDLMGRRIRAQQRYEAVSDPVRTRVTNAIGWSVAFFIIFLIKVYPGTPIAWLATYVPQISMWSWNLVIFIALASAIGGGLLSVNGLLRRPDDELVFDNSSGWVAVPVGLILLIGSGFFFLGAAGFYVIVGALQGSLSKSVLTVFGLVIGVVFLAALMYEPAAMKQVLLFGGNVAFLSSLFGWYTGSALKPLSAE